MKSSAMLYQKEHVEGFVNVYTDASSDHHWQKSCIGIVVDSSTPIYYSEEVEFNTDTTIVEGIAIIKALTILQENKIVSANLYTDSEALYTSLVRPWKKKREELSKITKNIYKLSRNFSYLNINLVNRFIVEYAHNLASNELERVRDDIRQRIKK